MKKYLILAIFVFSILTLGGSAPRAYAATVCSFSGTANTSKSINGSPSLSEAWSQPCTISSNGDITSATIQLESVGSPIDNTVYKIYSYSPSFDPGTLLATSEVTPSSSIPGTCTATTLSFPSNLPVTAGETIEISVERDGSFDSSNHVSVCVDSSGSDTLAIRKNNSWTNIATGDFIYSIDTSSPSSPSSPVVLYSGLFATASTTNLASEVVMALGSNFDAIAIPLGLVIAALLLPLVAGYIEDEFDFRRTMKKAEAVNKDARKLLGKDT